MSEEKQITSAESGRRLIEDNRYCFCFLFHKFAESGRRLIEDNRELIRIIGTALYPATEQLKFYQEAREEIRNMKLEEKERTSYELKVQEKAIAWEKEYLSRNNF